MKVITADIDGYGRLVLSTPEADISLSLQHLDMGAGPRSPIKDLIAHVADLHLTVTQLQNQVEALTHIVSHLRNPNQ